MSQLRLSPVRLTPEEVICQMSVVDLQELLGDLKMDASITTAIKLKRLVQQTGQFEQAMQILISQAPAEIRQAA
jgi:hypothetical protein